MNILHTNSLRHMVGEVRRILTLSLELEKRGHKVVIVTQKRAKLVEAARNKGLEVVSSVEFQRGFHPVSFIKDIYYLRKTIKNYRIDIIHTHSSKDSWAGAVAGRLCGKKVVRTRHNIFPVKRHLFNRWLYLQLTDHLIVISNHIFQKLTDRFMPSERVSLIHSAVNISRFGRDKYSRKTFRSELGLTDNRKLVGMVANVVKYKGPETFYQAAKEILKKRPDIVFVLVGAGDDNLEEQLKKTVAQDGLSSNFILTGERDDVPEIMKALDLFVLPSEKEGLGTVILEAMAMGVPVIASSVGGIPDLIKQEETGLLIPPSAPRALSSAIIRLLEDQGEREKLTEAAYREVRENFTPDKLCVQTENLYASLINAR